MDIVFFFYEEMTALDAIGPYEVLSRLPGARITCVAPLPGLITTCAGLKLAADFHFSQIDKADLLVVPGGGRAASFVDSPDILNWIQQIDNTTTWTTSVCTGSLILGAAGLLKGKPATSHWAVLDRLASFAAIPTQKRVVEAGKIITAAGVSAGIDMALLLAGKIAGPNVAQTIQLGIEYDPMPPFDAGSPEKAHPLIVEALRQRLLEKFAVSS